MARRRRDTGPAVDPDLRDELRAKYQFLIDRYPPMPEYGNGQWTQMVADLDAGEPVLVCGWQLHGVPVAHGRGNARFRVEADGSVVE